MSISRLVSSVTYAEIWPLVPAGTMAALATIVPVVSFRVETTGWVWPVGHTVRYPTTYLVDGNDCEVERVRGRADTGWNAGALQHWKIAWLRGKQLRCTQARWKVGLARVGYTARRQRVKGERRAAYRLEVAVDIDDHLAGVGNVNADRILISAGNNCRVGLHAAIRRIQSRD